MEKSEIQVGLPLRITGFDGFFVISELKDEIASLYNIMDDSIKEYPITDIEFAVNSSAQNITVVPLSMIDTAIDEQIEKKTHELELCLETQKSILNGVSTLRQLRNDCKNLIK